MAAPKVQHVIVDSGPFIRNAPLREVGEKFYTIREVVSEIRDKATRQRLQVLPYTLNFREPSAESIKTVTDFSKQTGDYASLSAVDLRLLALTYQLEKEHVGVEHIKTKADRKIEFTTTNRTLENPTAIAGFYLPKKDRKPTETSETITEETDKSGEENEQVQSSENPEQLNSETESEQNSFSDRKLVDGQVLPSDCLEEEMEDEENEDDDEDDEDEDDDDDGGWITPSNINAVREAMGDKNGEKADVAVGCMTGDFAMQNVLIQMGLNVISYHGMLIKHARSYVLRCHACFKVTTNMERQFCHNCGNKTLQKVSMSVNEDGSVRYHLSLRKTVSTRGLKYSLPRPKGGKHASNPILCEDQKGAQQRISKAQKVKYDALSDDYLSNTSPFAPIDISSRSAQLGIRNYQHQYRNKRNPNENRGRRK